MSARVYEASRLLSLLALVVGAVGCAQELPTVDPELGQLHFPSGAALTPPEAGEELLLVASTNFDLRFRSGTLQAFSVETIDALVEEALRSPSPGCPPEAPRCSPARVEDLGQALRGAVEIENYSGQVAIGQLPDGGLRAFVPLRGDQTVVAVDVDPAADGALRCTDPGEIRCRGVSFPRDDPFSVVATEGNVYVGHVGRDLDDDPIGVIGAALVDDPMWSGGRGRFTRIDMGRTPVGGVVTRCQEGSDLCTLYATGRSVTEGNNPVFLFDFRAGELMSGPLFRRNVYPQQRGFDTRGLAVSTDGSEIYVASRFPPAVATIDVTRIQPPEESVCVVPAGELVPPEGSCPAGEVPLDGEAEPRFVVADLSPAPHGSNEVAVIARPLPGGGVSDLVLLTTDQGLWFHDTRTGGPAGSVAEVGTSPNRPVVRRRGDGFRIYVPSFGHGQLAVLDMPDPFRPATARVIAILGRRQEGAF